MAVAPPTVPPRIVATILLGTILNPLNSSMIAVALVSLQRDFDVSLATVTWAVSAFYVGGAIGQPLMGRLADVFGAKRLFCLGWVLVAAVGLLAPLAPTFAWVVVARVAQALGTSAAFPAGLLIVRQSLPPGTPAPARTFAAITVAAASSAAVGPFVGGLLVAAIGWEAIFYVNAAAAVIGLPAALRFLPADPPLGPRAERPPAPRYRELVRNRTVLAVLVQFAAVNIIFYSAFFGLPQWFEEVRGLSPAEAGLLLLPVAGISVFGTPLAARLIVRRGPGLPLTIGSVGLVTGMALLLTLGDESSLLVMVAVTAALGLPGGFNVMGLQTRLYEGSPPEQTGAAGGLFQTARYVGAILASGLLAVTFGEVATTTGLHETAAVGLVIGLALLAVSLTTLNRGATQSA